MPRESLSHRETIKWRHCSWFCVRGRCRDSFTCSSRERGEPSLPVSFQMILTAQFTRRHRLCRAPYCRSWGASQALADFEFLMCSRIKCTVASSWTCNCEIFPWLASCPTCDCYPNFDYSANAQTLAQTKVALNQLDAVRMKQLTRCSMTPSLQVHVPQDWIDGHAEWLACTPCCNDDCENCIA